ncbi:Hypothetical predicted protein [Olea europaea subsp. europaea]|uniref:Uncharacterized protein n=1 Tax=Olea europaea subsp. europaea TaxID=158383 RepID=A0A8S0QMU3_OLEEU|nr:Hypothetical predicted protein [Olea europaea subsp. europaea]
MGKHHYASTLGDSSIPPLATTVDPTVVPSTHIESQLDIPSVIPLPIIASTVISTNAHQALTQNQSVTPSTALPIVMILPVVSIVATAYTSTEVAPIDQPLAEPTSEAPIEIDS